MARWIVVAIICLGVANPASARTVRLARGMDPSRQDKARESDASRKRPSDDEPTPRPGDEPTDERTAKKPITQEGAPGEEPEEQYPPEAASSAQAKASASYGVGIHFRGIFLPTWLMNAFLAASTPLNSFSLGGEFIRRKGNMDLVLSIDFGFYSPRDGNYMERGKNPSADVDYVQFRSLDVLAFEAALFWHRPLTPWLSIVYGVGLGFGVVLGDIYRISSSNCTPENLEDTSTCHPVDATDPASDQKWNENHDKWISEHTGGSHPPPDSPENPFLWREDGKWPVVPVLHLLLGVDFKVTEQINVRVDGGFHNAFYVGATGYYFF
jgi:hypothetical protein